MLRKRGSMLPCACESCHQARPRLGEGRFWCSPGVDAQVRGGFGGQKDGDLVGLL